MFTIILVSVLRRGKGKKKDGKKQNYFKKAMITFLLAVMFGVGWIFGVLGSSAIPDFISTPCQFMFVIIVGSQGLLVFLLHPCRSVDAREEWKKWFYYITCRANLYQEQLKQSKYSKTSSEHSSNTAGRTRIISAPSSSTGTSGATRNRYNRSPVCTLSPAPSPIPGGQHLSNSGTFGRTAELADKFGFRRPGSATSGRAAELAEKFGSRCPSNASIASGKAAESAMKFGSPANTLLRTETLIPSGQHRSLRSSLQVISDSDKILEETESELKPPVKPPMRQMYIFANNTDRPLTFGDDVDFPSRYGNAAHYVENNSDLICFSPDSDLFSFEENDNDGLVTWQTFEYDDELQTGETTLFYNFEDDF